MAEALRDKKSSPRVGRWDDFSLKSERRTFVEHATDFVPRRNPLIAFRLQSRKHPTVRHFLYVPLPVFSPWDPVAWRPISAVGCRSASKIVEVPEICRIPMERRRNTS